jgi:hypothetical protein
MIKVIDDIISKDYADRIENLFLSINFPWYYIKDITDIGNQKRPAFTHQLYNDKKVNSEVLEFLTPLIEASGISGNLVQARSFLQMPLAYDFNTPDDPHIDLDYPHTVLLYYVKDSDGDTVLYGYDSLEETQRVTPKKGRAVIFDGMLYHTALQPKLDTRCIINFDFYSSP